jgi:sugar/nucleoside kinase (ribokinase family)
VHIVCVGLATVDLVHRVDRIPGVDEKAQARSADIATGGPAANAAVTAAALGAAVTLVTAVGAHPLGRLIHDDLQGYGVRLLDATPGDTRPPPVSAVAVLTATGQRTIVSHNAAGADIAVPEGLDRVVADADVVLVDGHHPALAVAAVRAARRAGRSVLVDAGSWRPVMAQVLPLADVVACSATFRHPDAAPGDVGTAAALRRLGVRHVAVTHGPDPVAWWSGDHAGTVTVPAVDAVDTAGAGDAFHGALAVALARPSPAPFPPANGAGADELVAALRRAVTVAGIRVVHAGPRAWLGDPRLKAGS